MSAFVLIVIVGAAVVAGGFNLTLPSHLQAIVIRTSELGFHLVEEVRMQINQKLVDSP